MKSISLSNKPYFLGSVILKQQPTNTGLTVGDIRTVIDGQQRLTTINIFFKVLCLKSNQSNLFDRIFRLISTNNLSLVHNHNDVESFEMILNLTSLDTIEESNNITKAYSYFKEHVHFESYNIQNILTRVLFVGIDLDSNEDEQQIFDTINSLGVKLTTAELLKNYFFNRDEIEYYNEYWKSIFEKDDLTKKYWDREITTGRYKRTFIDLFFYSYLQIKIQETIYKVSTEQKAEYSKVDTLFYSFKSFVNEHKINKRDILVEIKEYAKVFNKNFNYDVLIKELPAEYGIERINAIIFGLDTSTIIPYILYVLKSVNDEASRNDLFKIIESYIMRRIITNQSTKNYNQLFTDRLISNEVLSKIQFLNYINKVADGVNLFPNNSQLENGFNNSYLINKQSAGIIYFIESKIRNRSRHSTQILGISKYSLEHLMPKKWENNWGRIEDKVKRDFRNRKINTLGNLAIITQSLNASIRDSDWLTKKNGKPKKDGLCHYSSGLETLTPFLQLEEWNEVEIENRASFLFEKACEIWEWEDTD